LRAGTTGKPRDRGIVPARLVERRIAASSETMERPSTDNEARIDELESRLAQQDQSILELSDELFRQQQQVAQLELQVRHLTARLTEAARPEPAGDPADDVPPHY
jgi:SlyX protein